MQDAEFALKVRKLLELSYEKLLLMSLNFLLVFYLTTTS